MGTGRPLRARGAAVVLLVLASTATATAAACGDDDDGDAPSATVGTAPPSTTSTTLSVEAEVEAAYLRSWDVYAEAMRTLDNSGLNEAFTEEALTLRRDEVARLSAENTPARMQVDHEIESIELTEDGTAVVRDRIRNHSVLLDPRTGEPSEADPNSELHHEYVLKDEAGKWKVALIIEL